jgi:hypothetical protein
VDEHPIEMRDVLFVPRTDGMVDVEGMTVTHDLHQTLEFLQRHPHVSDIQTIS